MLDRFRDNIFSFINVFESIGCFRVHYLVRCVNVFLAGDVTHVQNEIALSGLQF